MAKKIRWCPQCQKWTDDHPRVLACNHAGLSPEAEKAIRDGQTRQAMKTARMDRGPYLRGNLIVVPSHVYNPEAAERWRAGGFGYDAENREWFRDTRFPLQGRRYTPDAWLAMARTVYGQVWPEWKPPEQEEAP